MTVVVIGIGNAYRSDDGAGLIVAERLRAEAPDLAVVANEQEPLRLIDAWDGADLALVVDAVSSGAASGTIHRFDATKDLPPVTVFHGSTHAIGVWDAIALARTLGRLPRRVLVYGIEGERFSAGNGLTPAVAAAVESLVPELVEEARCTSVH
jgi:hydrogenase maturation protease